jgi:hypothetical protein
MKMFGADCTDDINTMKAALKTMSDKAINIESKLEKAIAAMDIIINRHNDLSKEFKESRQATKSKVKYIPEQANEEEKI